MYELSLKVQNTDKTGNGLFVAICEESLDETLRHNHREREVRVKVKCLKHNAELEEVETDYEYQDVIAERAKALRCPIDGEETFTLEQFGEIKRRISQLIKPLKLRRRVSVTGKRPTVLLSEDVVTATNIKIGDRSIVLSRTMQDMRRHQLLGNLRCCCRIHKVASPPCCRGQKLAGSLLP